MDMAAQPGGSQGRARGQVRRGIPPHAQLKRERIADHDACAPAGEAGDAVCNGGEDVGIFGHEVGRGVQEDVEAGGNVEVGFLQGSGEGEDEGDVVVLTDGERCAAHGDGSGGRDQRVGGDSTGERGIVVDVEFQEMEKGVGDFGDGAIDIF